MRVFLSVITRATILSCSRDLPVGSSEMLTAGKAVSTPYDSLITIEGKGRNTRKIVG